MASLDRNKSYPFHPSVQDCADLPEGDKHEFKRGELGSCNDQYSTTYCRGRAVERTITLCAHHSQLSIQDNIHKESITDGIPTWYTLADGNVGGYYKSTSKEDCLRVLYRTDGGAYDYYNSHDGVTLDIYWAPGLRFIIFDLKIGDKSRVRYDVGQITINGAHKYATEIEYANCIYEAIKFTKHGVNDIRFDVSYFENIDPQSLNVEKCHKLIYTIATIAYRNIDRV